MNIKTISGHFSGEDFYSLTLILGIFRMDDTNIKFLENKNIPDSVKVVFMEQNFARSENDKYEPTRLRLEGRKLWLGIPVIVAIVSVLSVTVTNLFALWLADKETEKAIQLEKLKQQVISAELIKVRFDAKIKEYEIISSQLEAARTPEEGAKVLIFLARSGILTELNTEELINIGHQALSEDSSSILPNIADEQ